MDIRRFVNKRPLCFISVLCGIRDIGLGAGYIFTGGYIKQTLLWRHYDALAPGVSGWIVGVSFALIGMLMIFFAVKNFSKWTSAALRASALLWLFATIMYAIYGEWALAIYLAGFNSVISGYIAYFYKFAPTWRQQRRVFRDEFIEKNDPLTHVTDRVRMSRKGEAG